ncbi:class I SAM-dependent methyltransferase [Actinomadura nitritigenes]|uniref:class I SAM-dependent methyltransferase n=1 Tax=Actinomadura nitritigenes TaxID=134602 RepID=UPI003D91864D
MSDDPGSAGHWEDVYRERDPDQVSWFQQRPRPSLDLILQAVGDRRAGVIDVGGGASPLAARLVEAGFADVTVLDVSGRALAAARRAAETASGVAAEAVTWVRADLLTWQPTRTWAVWHDRAVFHFLTDPADRATYLAALRQATEPGAIVVLGTFAADGPTHCSGLPVTRWTAEELAAELGDAFVLLHSRRHRHRTPAGSVQPFTWITARRI